MDVSRPISVWKYFLLCAILAAAIATTTINRFHSADSLVCQLESRHHWMPFYWEQDRIGMLWPLVTKPIEHPLYNLLSQTGLTIFCGLTFPFVFLRLLNPTASTLPASLATTWIVIAAPDAIAENWFVVCQYPSALFLGGYGLFLLRPSVPEPLPWWRVAIGFGLLALAHWVYVAVVFVVFPLAVVQWWCQRGEWLLNRIACYAVVVAFAAGFALMQWVRGRYPGIGVTPTKLNALATIPGHFVDFLRQLANQPDGIVWKTGTLIGLILTLGLGVAFRRRISPMTWRTMASLLAVALGELIVASSLTWPCEMGHSPRYALAFVAGLLLIPGLVAVSIIPERWGRWSERLSIAVMASALFLQFGSPSVSAVRADFDRRFGEHTQSLLNSGADAVSGEYWHLWPTVYHLELVRYEQGLPPLNNVVGLRTSPYWRSWKSAGPDGFLVAVPRPLPDEIEQIGVERGLAPLVPIREHEQLVIYRTRFLFAPFPGKPTELP